VLHLALVQVSAYSHFLSETPIRKVSLLTNVPLTVHC
jgi:hypothetical protein